MNIKNFYPTPKNLIFKMLEKIKGTPITILEPSAGAGHIIEALKKRYRSREISAIEIDEDLQAILKGKEIKLIDTNFLSYTGQDKFDLIIANPPFDTGSLHLLKAIDIMYRGEIIFLLNAETLKNPHTNIRKELTKKLKELNADIEYIKGAFQNSERPTGVEVALIYIKIKRDVEEDLFSGCNDKINSNKEEIIENYEVATGKKIPELVVEYNQIIGIGTKTIIDYYKNYKKIGNYIALKLKDSDNYRTETDLTAFIQTDINKLIQAVRINFWRETLKLKEIKNRMTQKKQETFDKQIQTQCDMDFTENNIRQFILNLIGGYEQTLIDAVLEIFNKFTIKHTFSEDNLYNDNIHYFNGWKTNKAFKVGKKVIIPVRSRFASAFTDSFSGEWRLAYGVADDLSDIDKVMNYFDGMSSYTSIREAVETAFTEGQSRKIKSTYFTITCYKKGTIHLTFNSEDILRRFNVVACKGKNWLPHEYGNKTYSEFYKEEKRVVDDFEGEKSYTKNLKQPLFAKKDIELIEFK